MNSSPPSTHYDALLAMGAKAGPNPELDNAIARELDRRRRQREIEEATGQLDESRERCKHFPTFIREAWHVLEQDRPFLWGWALDAIADHLLAVTNEDIVRLLINVPPGMMKSLMTGAFWPAYEWGPLARPSLRYLTGSFKIDHAERDVGRHRDLVASRWYQDRWGAHVNLIGRPPNPGMAVSEFANDRTGWRKGRAVSAFTGERGDRVIWDDPHSVEGGESATQRKTTLRVMRETVPTRLNDPLRSAIIVIMQRVHDGDVSGMILSEKLGYTHLMLPMRYEPARRCVTTLGPKIFRDPRSYDGELLFPERFPQVAVDRTEKEMTAYAVAGQQQQRPVPREGGMFKRSWFEIIEAEPMAGNTARCWDLAGGTKTKNDWTVGLKGRRLPSGHFLITDMQREKITPGKVATLIKNMGTQDGKGCVIGLPEDPGQAGLMQTNLFVTLLAGWTLNFRRPTQDKETRARPAATQAEHGMILLLKGDWNEAFLDEVCNFPGSLHDDIVDALSDLVDELGGPGGYSLDNVQ